MMREVNTHELKIAPKHFAGVVTYRKKAEFRINDRNFHAFDVIRLREYHHGDYTGREVYVTIMDVTDVTEYISAEFSNFRNDKRFVMLSINVIPGTVCNVPYLR